MTAPPAPEHDEQDETNAEASAELLSEGVTSQRSEEERITETQKNERVKKQLQVSGPMPWWEWWGDYIRGRGLDSHTCFWSASSALPLAPCLPANQLFPPVPTPVSPPAPRYPSSYLSPV